MCRRIECGSGWGPVGVSCFLLTVDASSAIDSIARHRSGVCHFARSSVRNLRGGRARDPGAELQPFLRANQAIYTVVPVILHVAAPCRPCCQ